MVVRWRSLRLLIGCAAKDVQPGPLIDTIRPRTGPPGQAQASLSLSMISGAKSQVLMMLDRSMAHFPGVKNRANYASH